MLRMKLHLLALNASIMLDRFTARAFRDPEWRTAGCTCDESMFGFEYCPYVQRDLLTIQLGEARAVRELVGVSLAEFDAMYDDYIEGRDALRYTARLPRGFEGTD